VGEDPRAGNQAYKFLVAQLELFGKLGFDRCDHAIDVITKTLKYLTWDECFHCMKVVYSASASTPYNFTTSSKICPIYLRYIITSLG
jgi:hypothetical protein